MLFRQKVAQPITDERASEAKDRLGLDRKRRQFDPAHHLVQAMQQPFVAEVIRQEAFIEEPRNQRRGDSVGCFAIALTACCTTIGSMERSTS